MMLMARLRDGTQVVLDTARDPFPKLHVWMVRASPPYELAEATAHWSPNWVFWTTEKQAIPKGEMVLIWEQEDYR